MTTAERVWHVKRLNKTLKEEHDAQKKAHEEAKAKARAARYKKR
jgi:hypothetical protein